MKHRVEKQAAYVLHTRPYRDTSALVDFFTLEFGKVTTVCRGLRRPGSRLRGVLQPFVPLQISWQGKNDLKTLVLAESTGHNGLISGDPLICGLYANELLHRQLPAFDAHPKLFVFYQYLLSSLVENKIEMALRTFERQLTLELGYDLDFSQIKEDAVYFYNLKESRFELVSAFYGHQKKYYFHGHHLLAINMLDFERSDVRQAAKRLMRIQIDQLLDGKELNSRYLFRK